MSDIADENEDKSAKRKTKEEIEQEEVRKKINELEPILEEYEINKLHNMVRNKIKTSHDGVYNDFRMKYNDMLCASTDDKIKLENAVEELIETQSKMHDFYRLLRSLKYGNSPSPHCLLSTPLSCDLTLKCQRIYAKFAAIQNQLDVYKYEMESNDCYIKERIDELVEIKGRIVRNISEINERFDKLKVVPQIPASGALPAAAVDRKPSHTHGIPKKSASPATITVQKAVYGLNKGGGATVIKSPAVSGLTNAMRSPEATTHSTHRTPASISTGPAYRPISTVLYEVSSQLGRQFTENNRNR